MAVYFRHGSNGAYKTAYAVWFEILPALRNGRLVVTNIEGIKPLESFEKILNEKFPPGAQLVRIFSRSESGQMLWQNWFSWMPTGALVVIDECQDLYTADVGFKREKAQRRPLEEFLPHLPQGFADLFYSRWTKVDLSLLDEGDSDDTGGTQVDDEGRLLYPHNFYGAFMRHRKYQWDIIMLTPDWTSIPTWLRGCAQEAYSHRSTDTFFRKRKPRIFNHRPTSSKIAPSGKSDYASCSTKKIPIDVFALYQSTGTGGFNESKSDISILKSPKFILSITLCVLGLGKFIWDLNNVLSDSDEDTVVAVVDETQSNSEGGSKIHTQDVGQNIESSTIDNSVVNGSGNNKGYSETGIYDALNPFYEHFPVFNGAKGVFVSGVNVIWHNEIFDETEFIFRVDKDNGSYYVRSGVLKDYGYKFKALDDCLVVVSSDNMQRTLTCPPNEVASQSKSDFSTNVSQLESQVDIFKLGQQS